MLNNNDLVQHTKLINPSSYGFKACLILLFLMAALIRRDEIRAPGHLIEREFNTAVFARAFYFENNSSIEPWRQETALVSRDQLPLLEPPLTEYFLSLVYRITGQEEIWYGRYLTNFFWIIGGFFLFKLTRKMISTDVAVFAVAYYLFVPWGIIISRSVQPDALMMMMFLVSLYSIYIYFKHPTWRKLLMAGIFTGITLLLRPLVIFALLGGFVALSLYKKGSWKRIVDKQFIVFILLSLAFPLAFYGYGIFIAGFLRGQAALSFRPHLLFQLKFWLNWFELSAEVVGYTSAIAAFLGFLFLRKAMVRFFVIGLLAGYLIFGVVFTFHIITHPYYHIQLFPIISICAAVFFTIVAKTLKEYVGKNWWAPAIAIFLFTIYFSYKHAGADLYTNVFEEPRLAAEIGDNVNHSPHTVVIAHHYGAALQYYGEFAGLPWPVRIDDPFLRPPNEKERSVQERLDSLGYIPEYFVITNFDLFYRKHDDLQAYLEQNCAIYAKQDRYLIYNACSDLNHSDT